MPVKLSRRRQEIVVTAQKREENLQDVPVAVSVVGGGQIEDLDIEGFADVAAASVKDSLHLKCASTEFDIGRIGLWQHEFVVFKRNASIP